jgi:hypothetical protein
VNTYLFYDITKLWLKFFGSVSKLTVPWMGRNSGRYPKTPPPESLKGAIKVANKWLKTQAVLVEGKSELENKNKRGLGTKSSQGNEVLDTCAWT